MWKFDIELDLIILLRKIKLLNLNNNARRMEAEDILTAQSTGVEIL